MAKTQPSRTMGKKHKVRAQKEAEQRRKVLLVLGSVGLLVALVLIMGLLRIYVLAPRQPVAIVEGVEVSTAVYRKRLLYEQFLIDEQIAALQGQFEQIGQAFADSPELQDSLRNQTLQQVQQLLFLRGELERTVLETMIEDELVKQEATRREISLSEAEINEAYEARSASRANGYTQIDANATITARALVSENATVTAENFTPTPTLTATVETAADPLAITVETIAEEATPPPTIPPPPTPTINVLAGDSLTQAVTDWEKGWQDVVNLTPDDLRELIRVELLKARLVDDIGGEADTMALQAQVRHILVETEEEALDVKKRLAEGEDLADLAEELSTDLGSGSNGGDLGWFSRGRMVAPFDEVAFTQEIGVISGPVETDFGWHIIEVLAREERGLEGIALTQAQRDAYDAWLADSRAGNIESLWTTDSPPPQFKKSAPDLQSLINPTGP